LSEFHSDGARAQNNQSARQFFEMKNFLVGDESCFMKPSIGGVNGRDPVEIQNRFARITRRSPEFFNETSISFALRNFGVPKTISTPIFSKRSGASWCSMISNDDCTRFVIEANESSRNFGSKS
jgi:hypothetical protein